MEPLADVLFQQQSTANPLAEAAKFVSAEKGVADIAAALAGARDIIAERVSDDANARARLRELYWSEAVVKSKVLSDKQEAAAKFKDYFGWSETGWENSQSSAAGDPGEVRREGFLVMRISVPEESVLPTLRPMFVTGKETRRQIKYGSRCRTITKRLLSYRD